MKMVDGLSARLCLGGPAPPDPSAPAKYPRRRLLVLVINKVDRPEPHRQGSMHQVEELSRTSMAPTRTPDQLPHPIRHRPGMMARASGWPPSRA